MFLSGTFYNFCMPHCFVSKEWWWCCLWVILCLNQEFVKFGILGFLGRSANKFIFLILSNFYKFYEFWVFCKYHNMVTSPSYWCGWPFLSSMALETFPSWTNIRFRFICLRISICNSWLLRPRTLIWVRYLIIGSSLGSKHIKTWITDLQWMTKIPLYFNASNSIIWTNSILRNLGWLWSMK